MTNKTDFHRIRTEADYKAALKTVSALVDLDPAPETPAGKELQILAIRIERYEAKRFLKEVCGGRKRLGARMRQR
ncbi:hypothetical protein [Burkholderia metallica]|uniref:hypothetical protein n=1 Tax=Burkholderia metallica TaxID=488729 RepID=UPI0020C61545|nr:hypothetical protein [Burkholderia metallica]